jgi:hypothetical protein
MKSTFLKSKLMFSLFILVAFPAMIALGAYSFNSVGTYNYGAPDNPIKTKQHNEKKDTVAKKDTTATDSLKKKKDKDEYAELIKKGGSCMEGLVTVRHIDDKWYFEVPDSLLGRRILAVTRFSAVPQGLGKFGGEEVNENVIYFEKHDSKKMLMRAVAVSQTADSTSRIYQTLKNSTIEPIVSSFKIIVNPKDKTKSLIDVTSLFANDNDVIGITGDMKKAYKVGGLAADRTFIDTIKTYKINVEVLTTRTYSMTRSSVAGSDTGSATLGLNVSMLLLPKNPMQKRIFDSRVGYFTSGMTIFSDDQHKTEHEQFVSRYRLVPKDVKKYLRGELVEPVKQIVYYIDPATPKKWVPYLKAGINDWNVAFEAAGFKNAIVAKDWPNDPSMSLDDARFCVLRYLPSEVENAYGPNVSDPRSGEIMESHICWFHNVMNLLTKWYMVQCGPLDKRAQTMKFDDKLMGELIRFVSSHEVGHTLGLRHNKGASYATPVEKLRDKKWVEAHGHTVSIMDYARFNYVAQPEDNISEKGLFPRINDYDKWAIKWGYQYRPEFKDAMKEKEKLMDETTKVLTQHPDYWFGGEGYNGDPRAQSEDLGNDNMKANEYGIKNLKRVIAGLPTWTKQTNDRYDDLREMYGEVKIQFGRYLGHVLMNITGQYANNMPGKEPAEALPKTVQKEAIDYVGRNIFTAPTWLYPENIITKTVTDPFREMKSSQSMALFQMFGLQTLSNIYSNSLTEKGVYKLDDYLNDVFNTVWKPIDTTSQLSASLRRSLQQEYLKDMENILMPSNNILSSGAIIVNMPPAMLNTKNSNSVSSDVALYVQQHLDKVESYLKSQNLSGSDINSLHYSDLLRRIKLMRDKLTNAISN